MEKLYEICRKHKLRVTPQRIAVYKAVIKDRTHPTADSVCRKVREDSPHISLDTVNRTLIQFAEMGLIDTVACSGQGRKYDPNPEPHHHLKCVRCGEVFDFCHKDYDAVPVPEEIQKNFHVIHKKVVLTGICKKCQKKKGR